MSTLHERLTGGTRVACKLCAYLGTLDGGAAQEWQRELALPVESVSHVAVINELSREKVEVTEASVRRHRRSHGSR